MEIENDDALNEAGWTLVEEFSKVGLNDVLVFNHAKMVLKAAIERWLELKGPNK